MPGILTHFLILELAYYNTYKKYPFLRRYARPHADSTWRRTAQRFLDRVAGLETVETFLQFNPAELAGVFNTKEWLAAFGSDSKTTCGLLLPKEAYVGSLGPDVVAASKNGWLFDTMHLRDSNHFVLDWLKEVEGEKRREYQYRHCGYIFGFLSHMAGDIIMHPYVNTFAGYYLQQPAFHMHPLMESNIDSYVAQNYFGATGLSDHSKAWAKNLLGGDITEVKWRGRSLRNPRATPLDSLVNLVNLSDIRDKVALGRRFVRIAKKRYTTPPGHSEVSTTWFNVGLAVAAGGALDFAYRHGVELRNRNVAVPFAGDEYDPLLVNHPRQEKPVDHYIRWAAGLACQFWRAAEQWLKTGTARKRQKKPPTGWSLSNRDKKFLRAVPNFNLDTGFVPYVRQERNTLVVGLEHSWTRYGKIKSVLVPSTHGAPRKAQIPHVMHLEKGPSLPWKETPGSKRRNADRKARQKGLTYA